VIVGLGLRSLARSFELNPKSFETMVDRSVLYREKAKLQVDPKERERDYAIAEEWRARAAALREQLRRQESGPGGK
jgi:hypothetical protein